MFLRRKFLGETPSDNLVEDVVGNLQRVLGTKRGCGHFLADFGLSETGYRTADEMVLEVSQEIKENIKRYEPRVVIDEIDDEYDDEGRVSLVVRCSLRQGGQRVTVAMNLRERKIAVMSGEPAEF
ncbi:MAG: GPW/gp25 family protein [Myxococcota bacterium]|nr:GPW/gp25 family protein [Myxococcota bacterium]